MSGVVGKGWVFPPQINDRSRIAMTDGGHNEIRQSIYIILNTAPGERVMHPNFGCQIQELLFWPANEQTAAIAERYVQEALDRWETRIIVHEVVVTPSQDERGQLFIEIRYEIKGYHDQESLVYPFFLNQS